MREKLILGVGHGDQEGKSLRFGEEGSLLGLKNDILHFRRDPCLVSEFSNQDRVAMEIGRRNMDYATLWYALLHLENLSSKSI